MNIIQPVASKPKWARLPPERWQNHDPAVRFLLDEIYRTKISDKTIGQLSGLSANFISNIRQGACPTIANLRAALNAIGYDLEITAVSTK